MTTPVPNNGERFAIEAFSVSDGCTQIVWYGDSREAAEAKLISLNQTVGTRYNNLKIIERDH